jgi:hypothetical protein
MANLADVLNLDNLRLLDAESLIDIRVLNKLEDMARDPQFDLEPGQALDFYEQLEKLVRDNQKQLQANSGAYNQMAVILWYLSWKAMPAMPFKQSKNILSENLIDSIKLGINVRYCLEKILGFYEFGLGPDKETRRGWIYSLENNQEKLGSKLLAMEGQQVQPTVENWLKSYNLNQPLTTQRAKFNQINFFDKSTEASQLGEQDKSILKQLLEVYDWLLFPPPGPQVIPDDESASSDSEAKVPYLSSEHIRMPGSVLQREEGQPSRNAQPYSVPEAPRPKAQNQNKKTPFPPLNLEPEKKAASSEKLQSEKPAFKDLSAQNLYRPEDLKTDSSKASPEKSQKTDATKPLQKPNFSPTALDPNLVALAHAPKPMNIQDILKGRSKDLANKNQEENDESGLKISQSRAQSTSRSSVPDTAGKPGSKSQDNPKMAPSGNSSPNLDIDKKLEDLKKKLGE